MTSRMGEREAGRPGVLRRTAAVACPPTIYPSHHILLPHSHRYVRKITGITPMSGRPLKQIRSYFVDRPPVT